MLQSWGVVVLLLVGVGAQSGDSDSEPSLSCSSHILIETASLTCRLEGGAGGGGEDDEDEEADSIQRITMCYTEKWTSSELCLEGPGDTVTSPDLSPVVVYNVTAHLRRGGRRSTAVVLKKIVKPRSPKVLNVTFNLTSREVVFRIGTPYQRQYLSVANQLFQLFIWSQNHSMTQNVTSTDILRFGTEHLTPNRKYFVQVRARALMAPQGAWSAWSDTFNFNTPDEERKPKTIGQTEDSWQTLLLTVCLMALLLVISSLVFLWKNRIWSYMWPSIPHPKDTLVQICRPHKGLLMNFNPEEFSTLKVVPLEKSEPPCEGTDPPPPLPPSADSPLSTPPSSTQTSHCSTSTTSVSTEELELSALLSSSDWEDGVHSCGPASIHGLREDRRPQTPPPEGGGGGTRARSQRGVSRRRPTSPCPPSIRSNKTGGGASPRRHLSQGFLTWGA